MRDRLESLKMPLSYLLAVLVFAGTARVWEISMKGDGHQRKTAGRIEQQLRAVEADVTEVLGDAELLDCLAREGEGCADARTSRIPTNPRYELLIYRGDSLAWWSDNRTIPRALNPPKAPNADFVSLSNGYYVQLVGSETPQGWRGVGLLPVQYRYEITNRYLSPRFAEYLGIPATYQLVSLSDNRAFAVHSISGEALFGVAMRSGADPSSEHTGTRLLFLLALICWFLLLYTLAAELARRGFQAGGLVILLATLFSSRLLMKVFEFPESLLSLPVFQPELYASPGIASSLGGLLLDISLWGVTLLYFIRHAQPANWLRKLKLNGFTGASFCAALFFLLLRLAVVVSRSLVLDSSIPMRLDEFFRLDAFSLLGLLALAGVLGLLLLAGRKLVDIALELSRELKSFVPAILVGLGLSVLVAMLARDLGMKFLPSIWGLAFVLLHTGFRKRKQVVGFGMVTAWIAMLAMLASGILLHANRTTDDQAVLDFAERKSLDRDPELEYLYGENARDIARRISQDPFVINYFRTPLFG